MKTEKTPAKRPTGRPRDARQQKLQIRLNDDEMATWRATSGALFLEVGTWVRSVVNQHLAALPTKKGKR